MGMFDSVYADCPGCGFKLEFQSKAGVCHMKRYHYTSVPAEVAADLDRKVETCPACLSEIVLRMPVATKRVKMLLARSDDPHYD